mgnify:CR=1 FL=1
MTEPTFEPAPEETPMSGPRRPDAAPRSEPAPERTPEEAPMSEPDAIAPQAGGGKGAADEESALRWQAADELLTALAVSPTAHRNLVEMRRAFERAEALGVLSSFSETSDDEEGSEGEVGGAEFAELRPDQPPQQESVSGGAGPAAGDAPVEASSGAPAEEPQMPEMSPEERAEVNDVVDAMATSVLPLAAEVLERLDAERIRPELVGLSRPGLDSALSMLGEAHREGSWRELPNEEFFERFSELFSAVEPLIRIPPLAPERGETGRIVAVLHRMPKQTVTRVTRVWNPLLLRIMISIGLRALRRAN